MRVLCVYTDCGPSYVRSGWGNVFQALGHEFRFWQPEKEAAFDVFTEYEPDLFIGTTYDLDRAVYKNIVSRPQMKVILYASAWGELTHKADRKKYPVVIVREDEKRLIERLKKETGKPDFVFIHVTDKFLEPTMGGWRTIGVKPVGILNATDTFDYLGGVYREELACDIAFVGGYWEYKARNLDRYLLPMCHPTSDLKIKLFGNQAWPTHQYLGFIDTPDVRDLFASALVCPNISEPHSTDLGFDIIERPFKVLSAGGFCVSDYVEEAREIFTDDELIMCENATRFRDTVREFIHHPQDRVKYMEAGKKKVLKEHTYFDRVAQMFELLGMEKERKSVLLKKAEQIQVA